MMNIRSDREGVLGSFYLPLCLFAFYFVLLSLSACENEAELISGLSFKQLKEVSVALNDAGIAAGMRKTGAQGSERYAVLVSESAQTQAIRVLKEYNLPRQEDAFQELTKGNAFLPESKELLQLRRDRALSLELESFLSAFAGVVEVKAVIRNQLTTSTQARISPTATILLKVQSKNYINEADVRTAILKALPEISPNDISLILSELKQSPISAVNPAVDESGRSVTLAKFVPFPFSVPLGELGVARKIIAGLLVLFIGAGVIVGYVLSRWYRPRVRKVPQVLRTAVIETALRPLPFERKEAQISGKKQESKDG